MIRGPVLPQQREALWSLVSGRLEVLERGLVLVFEGLDCSGGQFGPVDGLARDVSGAPVLVVLATEGDALLAARVMGAVEFLERLGDALAQALPEAGLAAGATGRVVVVGAEAVWGALEKVRRMALRNVQVCCLESFRIAGSERFAVRWLPSVVGVAAEAPAPPEFAVPQDAQGHWQVLQGICQRLDPMVRLEGDRFVRRIRWRASTLGEVRVVAGRLQGVDDAGASHDLVSPRSVHTFGDRLLRAFVRVTGLNQSAAGVESTTRDSAPRLAVSGRSASPRGESLRSALASAQLSPEEYSALGGPASAAGGDTEGAVTADDVVRIVSAQEGTWPVERSG